MKLIKLTTELISMWLYSCVFFLPMLFCCVGITDATILPINASYRGCYSSDGVYHDWNGTTLTGALPDYYWDGTPYYAEFHSFFVFDLAPVDFWVNGATLRIELESYNSPDEFESFTVYSVSTPIDDLLEDRPAGGTYPPPSGTLPPPQNTTIGQAIFFDLGSGSIYGTDSGTSNDVGSVVDVSLSSDAVQVINDNRGSLFALGIALDDIRLTASDGLDWDEWIRFSGTEEQRTHQLILSPVTVFASDRFYFTGLAFQGLYGLKFSLFSLKGDTIRDGKIALDDVILALQIASGVAPLATNCNLEADVNGDEKIGIEESIYNLQYLSGLRSHLPVFNSISSIETNEGASVEFKISATDDPDGDLLTYSASNLPKGATFDQGARTFSWTPTYSQAGTYSIIFTVADIFESLDSTTITITITVSDALPVFDAAAYFPLTVGNWWEFKNEATGEIHRSTISGTKSINGTNAMIYTYADGSKRYYRSDSSGVKLYGMYIVSDSYTGDIIFDSPLLLMANNTPMGTIQESLSSYSATIYIPDYGYFIVNVDVTSTTKMLDVENVTTAQTILQDCIKVSMQITEYTRETGETLAGDTILYWFYKGIGPVKILSPEGGQIITDSYVNGVDRDY